jgi:hypothetical protein
MFYISVADFPIVLATIFLGLHVFLNLPAGLLRASLVLLLFGGMVMLLLHSVEWVKSGTKLVSGVQKKDSGKSREPKLERKPEPAAQPVVAAVPAESATSDQPSTAEKPAPPQKREQTPPEAPK